MRRVVFVGFAVSLGCGKVIGIEEVTRADGARADVVDESPIDECAGTDVGVPDATIESYRGAVLADAPIGYWPLDEEISGDRVVLDRSERGVNGVANGPVRFQVAGATAHTGRAARMEGASYFLMGRTAKDYDFKDGSFTVEAWIRPAALDAGYRYLLSKMRTAGGLQGYYLRLTDGETGFVRYGDNHPISFAYSGRLVVGEWSHVVARYDSIERSSMLFVNGKRVHRADDFIIPENPNDISNAATLTWGANESGGALGGAEIDELAVYDKALPCKRIRAHYQSATSP